MFRNDNTPSPFYQIHPVTLEYCDFYYLTGLLGVRDAYPGEPPVLHYKHLQQVAGLYKGPDTGVRKADILKTLVDAQYEAGNMGTMSIYTTDNAVISQRRHLSEKVTQTLEDIHKNGVLIGKNSLPGKPVCQSDDVQFRNEYLSRGHYYMKCVDGVYDVLNEARRDFMEMIQADNTIVEYPIEVEYTPLQPKLELVIK